MAFCTNCGEKLQDDANNCGNCGSAIPKNDPDHCANCREKLQDEAKFCSNCGSAVPTLQNYSTRGTEESKSPKNDRDYRQNEKEITETDTHFLDFNESLFEIYFNLGLNQFMIGPERIYTGENIPVQIMKGFTRGFDPGFISRCTFYVLHYGSQINNFAIAKIEEDNQWHLLIHRESKKKGCESILIADAYGTNISSVEMGINEKELYVFNINYIYNYSQIKNAEWIILKPTVGELINSITSTGKKRLKETSLISVLLFNFIENELENPILDQNHIKKAYKYESYYGKNIRKSLVVSFFSKFSEDMEGREEIMNLSHSIELSSYVRFLKSKAIVFIGDEIPKEKVKVFTSRHDPNLIEKSVLNIYFDNSPFGNPEDGFMITYKRSIWYLLINDHGRSEVISFLENDSLHYIKCIDTSMNLNIDVIDPATNKINTIETSLRGSAVNALKVFIICFCGKSIIHT